jgi:flagellar FliL protein
MAEEKKDQDQEPKKKGKLMLFVILGVVVVVALGAGLGVGMMLGGGGEAQATPATDAKAQPEAANEQESVLAFDTFVVNLSDAGKDRFMKATLRAVVTDPEAQSMLNDDPLLKARVRDRVLSILTSRTFGEVSSQMGKESLRREIMLELNQILPGECVKEILFAEFIVQ